MIRTSVFVFALLLAVVACNPGQASARYKVTDQTAPSGGLAWSFDELGEGELPPGAAAFSGTWAVQAEADAPSPPNALCQTATAEFPALSLGDAVYADLVMSTRFKPISGSVDQAAGLIFRVQDQSNYYILRANALENNVNFYRYVNGRRSSIKDGKAEVPSGQWGELRLEVGGQRFRGFLNGQLVVEGRDGSFPAGTVGLWTKADSVTCFDDVAVSATASDPAASPDTGFIAHLDWPMRGRIL